MSVNEVGDSEYGDQLVIWPWFFQNTEKMWLSFYYMWLVDYFVVLFFGDWIMSYNIYGRTCTHKTHRIWNACKPVTKKKLQEHWLWWLPHSLEKMVPILVLQFENDPPFFWQNTDFSAQNDPFFAIKHWLFSPKWTPFFVVKHWLFSPNEPLFLN